MSPLRLLGDTEKGSEYPDTLKMDIQANCYFHVERQDFRKLEHLGTLRRWLLGGIGLDLS